MGKVNVVEKDGKKYIDGEEVLCEYKFEISLLKEILLALAIIIFFTYMKSKNFNVNIIWWIFLVGLVLGFIIFFTNEIKTIYNKGVYITKKKFITFSGKKINLSKIFYTYKTVGSYGWSFWDEINFYENNKFIFYSIANNKNEQYINFINTLILISKNKGILERKKNYYAKRKLIQTKGANDGK
jgi:hypothetical protein